MRSVEVRQKHWERINLQKAVHRQNAAASRPLSFFEDVPLLQIVACKQFADRLNFEALKPSFAAVSFESLAARQMIRWMFLLFHAS